MATAPTPRRMTRPTWLNIRVLFGVVLVVGSVALGAKVVGSAARTSPVWAAVADLEGGTVLTAADLVVAEVNLGERGPGYVDAASTLTGMVLRHAVRSGELIPAAALGEAGDGRVVSIAVAPDRLAPGVGHGSVIDLYLVTGRSAVIGEEVTTDLILQGVTVQDVVAPASGGLSGAVSNRYQIALLLSPEDADSLVRRLPTGEPMVVLRTGSAGSAGKVADDSAGGDPAGEDAAGDSASDPAGEGG